MVQMELYCKYDDKWLTTVTVVIFFLISFLFGTKLTPLILARSSCLLVLFSFREIRIENQSEKWEESEGPFYASAISSATLEKKKKNNNNTLSLAKPLPLTLPFQISTTTTTPLPIHSLTSPNSFRSSPFLFPLLIPNLRLMLFLPVVSGKLRPLELRTRFHRPFLDFSHFEGFFLLRYNILHLKLISSSSATYY